jgi:hypothetical protein
MNCPTCIEKSCDEGMRCLVGIINFDLAQGSLSICKQIEGPWHCPHIADESIYYAAVVGQSLTLLRF